MKRLAWDLLLSACHQEAISEDDVFKSLAFALPSTDDR